ncbi:hypothetical protein DB32_000310 [Sandaracinus amylolyticus]|uniref:Uncharacterized protein n=1 Tax=Sandaracinus amylolyticus TaxID=927083 RepID=A0A0F6VYX1_9BACT|nr:hypothetical protein DB32_000310 [Sandaracinus amylolyticus]
MCAEESRRARQQHQLVHVAGVPAPRHYTQSMTRMRRMTGAR